MLNLLRSTALAGAAMVATLYPVTPTIAQPMSVRALGAQEARLATIAYRIGTANAEDCPIREAMSGLVIHDVSRYEKSQRAAVSRTFSMTDGFGILSIVPGSVAERAGLHIDDEILSVGAYGVEDRAAFGVERSFARMEHFDRIFQTAAAQSSDGTIALGVRRGGAQITVPLRVAYGCGGKLALSSSNTENAWSDGRNIIVTTGMTRLSRSDDEIAFVIAHEMAHNILGHLNGGGSRGIFGTGSVKRMEIEADSYAVKLMSRGGYEPAGGISFLDRARRKMWWSFSLDHPGFGRRLAVVAEAMRVLRKRDLQHA